MIRSELSCRGASALMPEDRSGVRAGLLQEVVSQGERRAEILSKMGWVLWKVRRRFKGEISIRDQFSQGQQRSTVRCHISTVRLERIGKQSFTVFDQRRFQTLPDIRGRLGHTRDFSKHLLSTSPAPCRYGRESRPVLPVLVKLDSI
jgi:hypothetical protein